MSKLVVEGGHHLNGTIRVCGAKNSILKLMAASILGHGLFHITDVPAIDDVFTMNGVLKALGVGTSFDKNELKLHVNGLEGRPPEHLVKSMRASVQVMGPLLARLGWAEISLPGGCAIGSRPLDIHLSSLSKLGAKIDVLGDRIVASADRLTGADITFRYPSVGATENIMMAAALAKGETIIRNAAREPEIADIERFLNHMGAKVSGAGSSVIRVKGVDQLGSTEYRVIPDRIEAGTYLVAAIITRSEVRLTNVIPGHLEPLLYTLSQMGAKVESDESSIQVFPVNKLSAAGIETAPYPGFPTDLHPQFTVLAVTAKGRSTVTESVYDNRFGYIKELVKMGADIDIVGNQAVITGNNRLEGASVAAGDLRGGAALVVAALAAHGQSTITGIGHIDRGYEKIEQRLSSLGAKITRLD